MATKNSNEFHTICLGGKLVTPQEINERNREFWSEQFKLMNQRISDAAIYRIATNDMRSEADRLVPIKSQKTIEQALTDAEYTKRCCQSDFSRKGGGSRKCDALQELIVKIVSKDPDITQNRLFHNLRHEEGEGTVFSIDGKSSVLAGDGRKIHFYDHDGKLKEASVASTHSRMNCSHLSAE